ncbi:MAG: aldehyde dehydrogenase [Elusimicrobia bacterium]|nr:aldehyde dehydrogenase [Elusimicrobiota bacterium]
MTKTSKTKTETIEVINPATEEIVARLEPASEADVDRAVTNAHEALSGPWSKMTPRERGRILWRMAEEIRNRKEELALLETKNTGKPIRDSMDEVDLTATCYEYYGGAVTKFFGETIPVADKGLSFTLKEPVGVCALIPPWNYPMVIATWKLAPALACGNTVVLKPASWTPLTAIELGKIALKAGVPKGVVNVIVGPGKTVGKRLASHPLVNKVSLTGETETGKEILKMASETIKRVSLELGGKSPNIVFDDVDIDTVVSGSIFSVFSNCGQDCCARSRFIVHRKIYEKFLENLVKKTKAIKIGDPLDPKTQVGPMIAAAQRRRVLEYIQIGHKDKAKLLCGGVAPSATNGKSKGYYIEPAVFADAKPGMRIVQEEIFGPVVAVIPFSDEEDAVRLANDTVYGLSGSLWTRDIGRAIRVAKAVKSGVISINSSHSVHPEAPFGGYKQSGLGRELGMKALDLYSETKAIFISEA